MTEEIFMYDNNKSINIHVGTLSKVGLIRCKERKVFFLFLIDIY